MLAEDFGRFDQRHLGGHGTVGPDLEDQLVIVGLLTNTGVFHLVADTGNGRVDRVDGDQPDFDLFCGVRVLLRRGDIATALLDDELHIEVDLLGQRRKEAARVVDGDRGICLDEVTGHFTGTLGLQTHGLHGVFVALERDDHVLDVEDQVGDIFHDTFERAELVLGTLDLDAGDRGALQGGQQDAAKRVTNGRAEATLEGLDGELSVCIGKRLFIGDHTVGKFQSTPANTHGVLQSDRSGCKKGRQRLGGHALKPSAA